MVTTALNVSYDRGVPSKEQMYVFNAYSFFSAFALFMFGMLYLIVHQNIVLGWIEVTSSGLIFVNAVTLHITRQYYSACRIFLALVIVLLVVLLVTGGIDHTGILWYFTFPICAFFLTNKRQGLWWCALLFLVTIIMIILAYTSPASLAYSAITLQQLLMVLTVLTVGVYIYQNSHEILLQRAHENRHNLQKEKVQSDTVIDAIGEAVIMTSPTGHVLLMNRTAEAMLGWQTHELKGKALATKFPTLQPYNTAESANEKVKTNSTITRKDGSSFPASVEITPVVVAKKVVGVVTTVRDISDEVTIDRAKSEFVTLASHQLRTPASAIAWTSELLLSGDVGKLTDEQRDYIGKIYGSNKRLLNLLDDLLTVSSLELGSFPSTSSLTNVASVVHKAVRAQLKTSGASKKLHIIESYDEALPEVPTDANSIKIIVQRLISNAIKYSPPDATITISVRHSHEKLSTKSKGSFLIEVSDTGLGIPKHQQAKVFTKLFRADNIKKKDTDGTGLGLYITKILVERMGGKIWFSSEQNKGSQFSIVLPVEAKE